MVDLHELRHGMRVVGPDGRQLGAIDGSGVDGIKLAKNSTADGQHHHIAADRIVRVEGDTVHVSAPEGQAGAVAGAAKGGEAGGLRKLWPLLLGALAAIVLLALLLRSCDDEPADTPTGDAAAPVTTTAAPPVTPAAPTGVLSTDVDTYLSGQDATPRTFAFDRLNFDTNSAAIREQDRPDLDRLAQVLTARPTARVRIVGYADARGADQPNAQLGLNRARSVAEALVAKGVAANRIETASGGEADPADTNATAGGQFENRRTELVVLTR